MIQKFENFSEEESNEVAINFLLRTIRDRIINNIEIIEYSDGRESDINVDICMNIIKDDLKHYIIKSK